ncbi:MbnP family copper-binding protein [Marinobacter sp.]|uniref:MbnP family copper-binding protein n=1 Tax=Marinobacter sp. TaxID=50741 RepID=UPI002B2732D7|nr:MbnP family copper-binding protein [Marinobacter sp.]
MKNIGMAGAVSCVFFLSACGGSSSSTDVGQDDPSSLPDAEQGTDNSIDLVIPFAAVVGSDPWTCGTTYSGLGAAGSDVAVKDLRLFIHDLALVTEQGDVLSVTLDPEALAQNDRVALLDFRDTAEVNVAGDLVEVCADGNSGANPTFKDRVQGTVELETAVSIAAIRFTLGVPFDLNHESQTDADEPLRNPGMAAGMSWNWQNGYKFLAADVLPNGGVVRPEDAQWSSSSWNIHLGSTGCEVSASELGQGVAPEACPNENRIELTLPLNGVSLNEAEVQFDYEALVSGSNLGRDDGGAPGCMSGQTDPECAAIFERLALPWGEFSNSTGNPNTVVFSVVQQK